MKFSSQQKVLYFSTAWRHTGTTNATGGYSYTNSIKQIKINNFYTSHFQSKIDGVLFG